MGSVGNSSTLTASPSPQLMKVVNSQCLQGMSSLPLAGYSDLRTIIVACV